MFTEKEKECIKTWYDNVNKKRCAKNKYSTLSERELWIKQNPCPFSDKIKTFYNSGYGYKLLAKELNLTYSVIRLL